MEYSVSRNASVCERSSSHCCHDQHDRIELRPKLTSALGKLQFVCVSGNYSDG